MRALHAVRQPDKLGRLGLIGSSTGPPPYSIAWIVRFFESSRRATQSSISMSRSYKPSIPNCARSLESGTPPEIVGTRSRASTPPCAMNSASPTGWPTRACSSSIPAAAPAHIWRSAHRIGATLKAKGDDALSAQELKKAAMERVFGFEILPAPFVIAHLQLGLVLQNLGAPLNQIRPGRGIAPRVKAADSDKQTERVGVYLTNALTGWEPPKEPKTKSFFPEMEEEHEAAEKVKREGAFSSSSVIRPTTDTRA